MIDSGMTGVQVLVTSNGGIVASKWCHAIYFNRNWNCAQFIQADKIHRVGLEKILTKYYYHFSRPELKVDALKKKLHLMLDLIDSQEIPLFAQRDAVSDSRKLAASIRRLFGFMKRWSESFPLRQINSLSS